MQKSLRMTLLGGLAAFAGVAIACAAETEPVGRTASQTEITIYNGGLALVTEQRVLDLAGGLQKVEIADLSRRLYPETFSLSGDGLTVLSQSYSGDVFSSGRLFEASIGNTLRIIETRDGRDHSREGRLLAVEGSMLLLQVDGGIERINSQQDGVRIAFDTVPQGLRLQPGMLAEVQAKAGKQSAQVRYLTEGLGWQADYVLNLNRKGTQGALEGFVSIANGTGMDFEDAKVHLVAGSINIVRDTTAEETRKKNDMFQMEMDDGVARLRGAEPPLPGQQGFAGFQLYELPRKVTLRRSESQQVVLLRAADIVTRPVFESHDSNWWHNRRVESTESEHPTQYIEFDNKPDVGPDAPLPGGVVRVYRPDKAGVVHFAGSNRIGHTAKGEEVRVDVGEAFDITIERKQLEFDQVLLRERPRRVRNTSRHEIRVRNGGDDAAEVELYQGLSGDWRIVESSAKYSKESAFEVLWKVTVQAGKEAVVTYKVITEEG